LTFKLLGCLSRRDPCLGRADQPGHADEQERDPGLDENDIYDIDALEAAVPYCDVVVTEKYACEIINRSGLADCFSTKVVRRLDDLIPILQSLP
jgi:hypothetical protein